MKTLRDYINIVESSQIFQPADPKPNFDNRPDMALAEDDLEEVSRRDFLKGAGAAAVGAAGALAGQKYLQQTKEKRVPDDKVAYYLLGEYEAISHLSDYVPEMRPWEAELKPYIEDIWARREAGDLPDEYDQAYTDGFENTERFLKSQKLSGIDVNTGMFNDVRVAKQFAAQWKSRHDKLIARLK